MRLWRPSVGSNSPASVANMAGTDWRPIWRSEQSWAEREDAKGSNSAFGPLRPRQGDEHEDRSQFSCRRRPRNPALAGDARSGDREESRYRACFTDEVTHGRREQLAL